MGTSTIFVAAAVSVAGPLPAVDAQALVPSVPGEFRVYEENDFFNPFTERTDRYYTQGTKLEWLSHSSKADKHFLPGISHADWCSLVCGAGADDHEFKDVNTGYAIGQNMYTPMDITIAAPQPFDRPWAGLLYASRIARITYDEKSLRAQRQDRIEVSFGVVGRASLAEELQIAWHKLINDDHPAGWDNQLSNEPVLQLRYETALRWPQTDGGNRDVITRARGHLGNALISLEGEVTGRIGWNLSGFGVRTIPGVLAHAARASTGRAGTGWRRSGNLFVRAAIKAVAHNIFLDGNSFASNDIRIDRKPFVPEIAAGVELNLVRRFSLSYQFIRRGSEFRSRRDGDAPTQEFGAISLAYTIDSERP